MVSPAAGKVVLVPFPFSDLSRSKLRPAVVLADAGRGDWILCQVTSKPYGDLSSIGLTIDDSGAIAWNEEIALCPDALYLRLTGKAVNELFPKVKPASVDA